MKRTAAILGPTPPFLRWAIEIPCPFRDASPKSIPDAAFRQLRSLRALSVGEIENRIVDGVCLHSAAASVAPEQVAGFPVEEIYDAYGGREKVDRACGSCVANVPISSAGLNERTRTGKAGCFGWLAFGKASGSNEFQKLMRCEPNSGGGGCDESSILEQFDAAIDAAELGASHATLFRCTTPAWYGVWSHHRFSAERIEWLLAVADQIESQQIDWLRLRFAIEACKRHDLTLHVEILPAGESDGVYWTVQPSCSVCGVSMECDATLPCSVCGAVESPNRSRKLRVLGMRPYLNLKSIIGLEAVKKLQAASQQNGS